LIWVERYDFVMNAINFIAAFSAFIISISNLVGIYKINKWIEKNNMDMK